LLVLPVAALCWTRLVIVSRRGGASAPGLIFTVVVATVIAAALTFHWLRQWWPGWS